MRWALLEPTPEFAATMARFEVPASFWPFTVEQTIPAALRRQALAVGAYGFADEPPADLVADPALAKRLFPILAKLEPDDDACFHRKAPDPAKKEAFAAWITAPERRTPETFAAWRRIVDGLRALTAAEGR